MKTKFIPSTKQLEKGIDKLNRYGIVFESIDTFPHNRANYYVEALNNYGYQEDLLEIGVEVPNQGWMYAVYDSNKMDYEEAKKRIIQHFIND